MKDSLFEFLVHNSEISFVRSENEHLRGIREKTSQLPLAVMQTDPVQARFIAFLASTIGAKKVLELGTFTGYTTLSLALAMPESGRVITCDISTRWKSIARYHWDASGMSHKIDFRLRSASHVLNTLIGKGEANTFDLIYVDADKGNQDEYYEKSLQLLKVGGLILIDNIFMGGLKHDAQIDEPRFSEAQISAVRTLSRKMHNDRRVDHCVLPVGDGLALITKL